MDVPLSFVVGSDGYIYEGRGWHHLGTHTRGQNSYGYGVAFIGNYSSSLPSRHALDLVRQHLAKCAVDGGRLQANFTLHGHRQLVDTSCPGDALYSEIRGWEHFGVRDCSVFLATIPSVNVKCILLIYTQSKGHHSCTRTLLSHNTIVPFFLH